MIETIDAYLLEKMSRNTFKIVSTKEAKGICFLAVPHGWEKDGILYWPEKNFTCGKRELLRSDSKSVPGTDWTPYKCVVKCSNLSTFEMALKLEKQISECSDTEAEENLFTEATKSLNIVCNNRNYMFDSCINETDESEIISPTEYAKTTENIQTATECEPVEIVTTNLLYNPDWNNISEELKQMKEEIVLIREEQLKLTVYMDKIYRLIVQKDFACAAINLPEQNKTDNEYEKMKKYEFPLKSVDEITQFNKDILNDSKLLSVLIKEFSKIGGVSGDQDGTKIAYKLVDCIISPDILTEYSWTGISRMHNEGQKLEKKSFSCLDGILKLFFEVILLADNRHTIKKNEKVFKEGVLKHAKKRCLRKRVKTANVDENDNENYELGTGEQ